MTQCRRRIDLSDLAGHTHEWFSIHFVWHCEALLMPVARCFCAFLLLTITSATSADEASVDYATQVKPILARHCAACHGVKKQQVG
jgi:hypothetical protein